MRLGRIAVTVTSGRQPDVVILGGTITPPGAAVPWRRDVRLPLRGLEARAVPTSVSVHLDRPPVVEVEITSVLDPGFTVGDTYQIVAQVWGQVWAWDTDGAGAGQRTALTDRVVTYSSSAPSVASVNSTTGLVTGQGAGTTSLTATCEGITHTDTLTITIEVPVQPVVSVTLSQYTMGMNVGSTAVLQARARAADGSTLLGRTMTWASSTTLKATVGPDSESVAGVHETTVTAVAITNASITASCEGISSSPCVLTMAEQPVGVHPNEPAGFTRIFEHAFSVLPGAGTGNLAGTSTTPFGGNSAGGAGAAANFTITQDATAPISPSSVHQIRWNQGLEGGYAPGSWNFWNTLNYQNAYREVYTSMWAKIPHAYFEAHPVQTKIFYLAHGGDGSYQNNQDWIGLKDAGAAMRLIWRFSQSDDRGGRVPGSAIEVKPNINTTKLFTTLAWHHLEIYANVGTPLGSDGQVKIWLDGILLTDRRDLNYLDPQYNFTRGFYLGMMAPVWGGNTGVWKQQDDFLLIDHFYVSGRL